MDAAYSSVERTNVIIRSLFKFGRTAPKVPTQEAQGGVCTVVDRVYMRGPTQLICESDPKILGYLDTGQYVTTSISYTDR